MRYNIKKAKEEVDVAIDKITRMKDKKHDKKGFAGIHNFPKLLLKLMLQYEYIYDYEYPYQSIHHFQKEPSNQQNNYVRTPQSLYSENALPLSNYGKQESDQFIFPDQFITFSQP